MSPSPSAGEIREEIAIPTSFTSFLFCPCCAVFLPAKLAAPSPSSKPSTSLFEQGSLRCSPSKLRLSPSSLLKLQCRPPLSELRSSVLRLSLPSVQHLLLGIFLVRPQAIGFLVILQRDGVELGFGSSTYGLPAGSSSSVSGSQVTAACTSQPILLSLGHTTIGSLSSCRSPHEHCSSAQ